MIETAIANQVIESLRRGLPPQRGTGSYAVGHDKLIGGIRRFHLGGISDKGIIRFVSGSWGAGKTHFFRLMREEAFDSGCLVSAVELNVNEAPLNKFERVFHSIIRNVVTPNYFSGEAQASVAPFGILLREALVYLATGVHGQPQVVTHEDLTAATEKLMACEAIDIDFRKIVKQYWDTYLPDSPDPAIVDQGRDELLQWFSGEGTIGQWRKNFGVNKVVSKDNAKLMLQSLAAFIQLAGYKGLVILFDEAEMSYSIMRKSALKDAHNNLLHLLNNVSELKGLFLLYATTPDFYTDPKHGIVIYGALAGRIGKPIDRPPKALENVWNLDAIEFTLADYQEASRKIRGVYLAAYPEAEEDVMSETTLEACVSQLHDQHPRLSQVRFWRVLTATTVRLLDDSISGEEVSAPEVYNDVMADLREN
jgi:hypothetical protein